MCAGEETPLDKGDVPAVDLDINGARHLMEGHCSCHDTFGGVEDRHMWFGAEYATTVGINGVDGRDFVRIHDLGVAVGPTLVVDVEDTSATEWWVGRCVVHWRHHLSLGGHGLGLR